MNKPKSKIVGLNSFNTISVIGKGAYAKVILVRKKSDGKYYAMKVLKKDKIKQKKQVKHVIDERNILVNIPDSPFLVKLYHSFQTTKKLYFVMDYCKGGELFNLLLKFGRFSENQTRFLVCQIILALEHLHKYGIIYRDLKPENVLLCEDGYLKIADFGLSKILKN